MSEPGEGQSVEKIAKQEEREAVEKNRANTVLVTVDNDPESRTILRLAEKAGISFVKSDQPHGARLDREEDVVQKVLAFNKGQVWIVEMPGPQTEDELRQSGQQVQIIDHHTYPGLDRVRDPLTGQRQKSSLEQFLHTARVSDQELTEWGFDPKVVRGLGILDDRFVQGLRDEGYSKDEINRVLDAREQLRMELDPDLEAIRTAAKKDWQKRREEAGYTIVESDADKDIRAEIATLTIYDDVDTKPIIISSMGGDKIYVQNIDPGLVQKLKEKIPGNTFSFGAGRCWGIDFKGQAKTTEVNDILKVLSE